MMLWLARPSPWEVVEGISSHPEEAWQTGPMGSRLEAGLWVDHSLSKPLGAVLMRPGWEVSPGRPGGLREQGPSVTDSSYLPCVCSRSPCWTGLWEEGPHPGSPAHPVCSR